MTPQRTLRNTGTRGLVWLMLVAMVLMGLTVARQQALGPLHLHAEPGARGAFPFSAAVSGLASDWLSRWRQQQVFGHKQLRFASELDGTAPWPPSNPHAGAASAHTHQHDALERHHHAIDDASVVALDGAAQAADTADSATAGATVLLPAVASPNGGLAVPAAAAGPGPWPVDGATAFASRSVAPLLRPPAA